MCSEPVTFGGGMTIVHGVASGRSGRNRPRSSQCAYQRASMLCGSKVLGSSLMRCGKRCRTAASTPQQLRPDVVVAAFRLLELLRRPGGKLQRLRNILVPAINVGTILD